MNNLRRQLAGIVEKHIPELAGRGDLKQYLFDSKDFFETSVWSLEEALKAAFWYGYKCGKHNEKLKNKQEELTWKRFINIL